MASTTASTIDKNSKVVITGASGFVAGAVADELFQRGYTNVHGSVRDLSDQSKTQHLREQFPLLHLFQANLDNPGSFDEAISDAVYVFHVATPALFQSEDNQRLIIDPAVNGTLDVLKAAEKSGTVKRVVYTSSVVAVADIKTPTERTVLTEADWNTDASVETSPYNLSKTLAEKAAWKFIDENHAKGGALELVTINPAVILGPPLSTRGDQFSINILRNLLNGEWVKNGTLVLEFGVVDVRDVALAHVLAIETPAAQGRYILSSEAPIDFLQFAQLLQKEPEYQGYTFPTHRAAPFLGTVYVNNEKTRKELGLELRPIRDTLLDTGNALKKLGLLPEPETVQVKA